MKSAKTFTLLTILLLLALATLIVNPVKAASKPSTPEFTVQYVDHSYDIPPTYGTDPYTGKTIITNSGSHVDKRTIDITIQYQPFTAYMNVDNKTINLYYNVRSKGHFEDWSGSSGHSVNDFQASPSGQTLISVDIGYWGVSQGGQIDFQVEAATGYPSADSNYCGNAHFTEVDVSNWSSTQTITIENPVSASPTQAPYTGPTPTAIPYSTTTPATTQNPTATPSQPDTHKGVFFGVSFDWEQTILIVMAIVIAALAVTLVLVLGHRRNPNNSP